MTIGSLAKSIAAVCRNGRLAKKLAAAAEIGFDGVWIFENGSAGETTWCGSANRDTTITAKC